ncbi:MAG TPA: N-acetyltransferase [Burkholderiales bacterium]|nr:N-acetyltransferase [Burkholderiales bacterium]
MPLIRPEDARDFDTIRELLLATFGREAESRLVERLRASGKIASALVAEEKERILGHVVFSKIATDTGGEALALAPLAVVPAFQRLGIGSALVSAGLERCRKDGQPRVLVLGDPLYYSRFGFAPAARFGLKCPLPAADASFMAMEMESRAFAGVSSVRYGHEFEDLE